jgi:DNA modification methylase
METGMPKIRWLPINALKPHPRNARTHSKAQIQQIANSIERFGWTSPIVADEEGYILAGHGRHEAAKHRKLSKVPVIVVSGLNDGEKRALMLADNKIASNAGYDRARLASELGELAILLPELNLNLEITGFATAEIDNLISDLGDAGSDPSDKLPPIDPSPVTRSMDLWRLGDHRLLCGDATDAKSFRSLMGGKQANLVFSDPPYNVKMAKVQGRGKTKYRDFLQGSGELSPEEYARFIRTVLSNARDHSTDGSLHYWFTDWRQLRLLLEVGEDVYQRLVNIIVWTKPNPGLGDIYRSGHELICLFQNGSTKAVNNVVLGKFGRNRSNVWCYPNRNSFQAGREGFVNHPTPKPVQLVADAIRDCTRRGDAVLDPFMGSGTTILAAEQLGRRAYGLEIDPVYADLSIRRWQAHTGRDAILKSTGQTFDEVADERSARVRIRRAK